MQIVHKKTPPPGFEFIPIGNPLLSSECKELSREKDYMIFIVSVRQSWKCLVIVRLLTGNNRMSISLLSTIYPSKRIGLAIISDRLLLRKLEQSLVSCLI